MVFQASSGALELRTDANQKTFWLTQQQVAAIFDVQKSAISKHIRNIFDTGELSRRATVSILETVQMEGDRSVTRNVEHYNLDLVLSVGYRVNSKKATSFRQWATKTLHTYVMDGFAIDKRRVAKQYDQFAKAVESVKRLLPAGSSADAQTVLELISLFSDTWLSLDAYDKDSMPAKGSTTSRVKLTADALGEALRALKTNLLEKDEATDLFGQERSVGSVAGIVGNVMQSFGGREVYPTVEEKAAHLLYFVVKNHPFSDGNKRSGAYAFVWFLRRAKRLDTKRITPVALTAITLLVAESNPKEKNRMARLIMALI
ncbi:MAG: virulence protein RhuM/Fic/DOC family protein [Candidatus Uhrbacteria bacterium]